jgi:hypothetical protein
MGWWANYIASWVSQLSGLNSPVGAVLAAFIAAGLWVLAWHRRRRKEGKAGVENWHLLLAGITGTWLFLSLTMVAAALAIYTNQSLTSNPAQDADVGPLRWYFNLEMEGGPTLGRPVFALTFFGGNRSQKEVFLKSANIVSAKNGKKVDLEVLARNDKGENTLVPIADINLIPPGAPVRLIAKFGDPDPNAPGKVLGQDPKMFLETWSQFYLNVEDDSRTYRLPFNEGNLMSFFPGMVGPHITSKK